MVKRDSRLICSASYGMPSSLPLYTHMPQKGGGIIQACEGRSCFKQVILLLIAVKAKGRRRTWAKGKKTFVLHQMVSFTQRQRVVR